MSFTDTSRTPAVTVDVPAAQLVTRWASQPGNAGALSAARAGQPEINVSNPGAPPLSDVTTASRIGIDQSARLRNTEKGVGYLVTPDTSVFPQANAYDTSQNYEDNL